MIWREIGVTVWTTLHGLAPHGKNDDMSITAHSISHRVYLIKLTGLLTWDEFQAFGKQMETAQVFATGPVRALIQLEEFTGWEPGEAWSDVSFFFEHDQHIQKIAVVGDACWRDEMSIFLFADYRQAPTRFFAATEWDAARAWVLE